MDWQKAGSFLLAALFLTVGNPDFSWAKGASSSKWRWSGTVTYISDGDTLWVRPAHGGAARKIRVDGIDAPEICQSYGPHARDALSRHVLGQPVKVAARRRDNYGRDLARLDLHGEDVGGWMVTQGHAWSYRYRHDAGPYAGPEAQARAARRGLFGDPQAEHPRDFRKRHGSCH